jgi:hypothetical protein
MASVQQYQKCRAPRWPTGTMFDFAMVFMGVVDKDGNLKSFKTFFIDDSSEWLLSLKQDGGEWEDRTVVNIYGFSSSGMSTFTVQNAYKEVVYLPSRIDEAGSQEHDASCKVVIGSSVNATADFNEDDGTYTGIANGRLITRPDLVFRFILKKFGYTDAQIDSPSFDAAGAIYASMMPKEESSATTTTTSSTTTTSTV